MNLMVIKSFSKNFRDSKLNMLLVSDMAFHKPVIRFGLFMMNTQEEIQFIMKILIHLYVKSICRFSHRIIVENKIVKSGLEEYFDVSSEKINVINNAVPQEIGLISNIKRKEFLNKFSNNILVVKGTFCMSKLKDFAIFFRSK